MPKEEARVLDLLSSILGGIQRDTPDWLLRPGKQECGSEWGRISAIFRDLTGASLPESMRPVERRSVDGIMRFGGVERVFEYDETQHFNCFRAQTLTHYLDDVPTEFGKNRWLEESKRNTRLEGGGFAAPKPPLFPGENGRHRQRAFRDALCDLLPPLYGYAPTMRIAHFEVSTWLGASNAEARMRHLLSARLGEDLT